MTGEGQGLDLIKISVGNTCLLHTRLQSYNTVADLVNVKKLTLKTSGSRAADLLHLTVYFQINIALMWEMGI